MTAGLLLFALAAGQPSPHPHLGPMFLPEVNYGTPLGLSAGLSVFLPTSDDGQQRDGFIVDAFAGQGGARVGVGRAGFLEYVGLDGRITATRTFGSPRGSSAKSTYAGAEGGLTLAYVRVSAGVARRVSGPSGPDRTIFTWTVGVLYPIAR